MSLGGLKGEEEIDSQLSVCTALRQFYSVCFDVPDRVLHEKHATTMTRVAINRDLLDYNRLTVYAQIIKKWFSVVLWRTLLPPHKPILTAFTQCSLASSRALVKNQFHGSVFTFN